MASIPTFDIPSLEKALDPTITSNQLTPPIVRANTFNQFSPNAGENGLKFAPSNTPIYVSGNAATADTAIKKGNETLSHACDSSSYVGLTVAAVGAFAGKIIRAIREAISAIQKALGFNPSSSGLVSQLKKVAQFLKDVSEFIKEITNGLLAFVEYMNAIKAVLAYILSLPQKLLKYFADCIKLLKNQLVASYKEALGSADVTDKQVSELTDTIKEVNSSIKQFETSVSDLAKAGAATVASVTSLNQISSGNTTSQAETTAAVFAAAGFTNTSQSLTLA